MGQGEAVGVEEGVGEEVGLIGFATAAAFVTLVGSTLRVCRLVSRMGDDEPGQGEPPEPGPLRSREIRDCSRCQGN